MIQPKGFTSTNKSKVCKLNRSTYGLKQASQSWNMHFDKMIKIYDFIKNGGEPCIYKQANGFVIIVLYVDDIPLIENDIPALQNIKLQLSSQFSIKNLRQASYILKMKIYRDRSKMLLGLFQTTYIDTVLKQFSMKKFKKGYLLIG